MTGRGKLTKSEMETLSKAIEILTRWTEWAENDGMDYNEVSGWQIDRATNAICELYDFIESYETE